MNQSLLGDLQMVMQEAVATGLFRSRCTIKTPGNPNTGAPSGSYTNVAGLVNIVCMDAPQPPGADNVGAQSARSMAKIETMSRRHVLLDNYYPTLITGWRTGDIAVISTTINGVTDEFTSEICGVEADSQRTQTRMELKLAFARGGDVMKLMATATYKPRGTTGQYVETHITPAVRASVKASAKLVETAAKAMCPVDTGALRDSISTEIDESGKTIIGRVSPHMPYAAYVEFGTGIAGAGSAGAGSGPYNTSWPGMVAQPYMRPAIDENRGPVVEIFRGEIELAIR